MATFGSIPSNADFTGIMLPYAGSTAPDGWLLCDGSAVSRTTFADLFAIVGTTYGAGDGSTTFGLPDFRGRVPLGLDNMGGTPANRVTATQADNLGQGAGAETHTLTTSEMPSHAHNAIFNVYRAVGAQFSLSHTGSEPAGFQPSGSVLTDSQGGGSAHNNMQPYMAVNYIIKT